ncbi:ABC transporter [Lewinellaceae bacterium SD302]|nr:ABC transporter [Lewinellaceae bacterium SD302]
MIYLELKNVSKSYGEKVLFNGVDLPVNKGAKMALVAKNGTGKSTLLRVAAGIDNPEGVGSECYVHRDARLAYLPQEPDFGNNQTVLEAVFDSDNEIIRTVREYEEALILGGENGERLQKALTKMDRLQAWDTEAKIKETLSKLNIKDINQQVATLSGGQRKRVALAKLVIDAPDLIIMDEPTNHLDLDMIEWLEDWLQDSKLTLLMVTHDRYFLERVCDTITELDGGELYKYSGNYSDYLNKKALRYEISGAEHEKDKKRLKKELAWARRMPSARTTKSKSRLDKVDQLQDKVGSHKSQDELTIEIKGQRLGKKILESHNISKSYGDLNLVENFDYKFRRRERVGIIGPNGVGKSTFLGMLTKEIRPDTGKVVVGDNTVFGYYNQEGMKLDGDKRVIEVIRAIAEYIPLEKGLKLTAASLLEKFLFNRKQQQVYVSQLSGGEKRRLYLLTILMKNPNFLILDEPTNDLDIVTINVLEEFLLDFPGCVLIVSHDRFFLDKLAQHIFVFEGNGVIRDWNGTFSEYRTDLKARQLEEKREAGKEEVASKVAVPEAKTENQISQDQRKAINRLESQIAKLEKRKASVSAKFADAEKLSPDEIAKLGRELNDLNEQIEEKEMEWMEMVG